MTMLQFGGTSTFASSSSSGGAAGTAIAVAFFVVLILVVSLYHRWLRKGLRPRTMTTSLSGDQLRTLFAEKVANLGWKVIDNDNPMVAQSPLIAGIRQQITLTMTRVGNGICCDIRPTRIVKKWGNRPTKAHTLRMRLNAFERAVNSAPAPHSTPLAKPAASTTRVPPKTKAAVPPTTIEALPISLPPPPSRTQVAIHFGGEPSPSTPPAPEPSVPPSSVPPSFAATPPTVVSAVPSAAPQPPAPPAAPTPAWLTPVGYSSPPSPSPVVATPVRTGSSFAAPQVFAAPKVFAAHQPSVDRTFVGPQTTVPPADDNGAGDHDGRTMTAAQLAAFRAERAARSQQVRVLTGDLGGVYEIDGFALIGRNPSPRPGESPPRLIAVRDPSQTLSKTHAALGVDGTGLWVEDRGSSNGTVVSTPDGATVEVSANRVAVADGATVYFGDRAFVVSRPT